MLTDLFFNVNHFFSAARTPQTTHARLALSLAAQAKLPLDKIDEVIAICEETAKNKRWKIRGAVLPFLQVLAFSRLFAMRDDRMAKIRAIVFQLLGDEQLEVRESATHTLVPLIRDAPTEAIQRIRSMFYSRLERTRKPMRLKLRNPKAPLDPKVCVPNSTSWTKRLWACAATTRLIHISPHATFSFHFAGHHRTTQCSSWPVEHGHVGAVLCPVMDAGSSRSAYHVY